MKCAPSIAACTILMVAMALTISAEVPQTISYQGRLTDDTGQPVADGDYNITFQITEHSPMPMGETPLWSSGMQAVSVTDGLFVYYLGSNVPLPASIFTDDGLDSHYLRFALEGSPVYSSGVKLASVPFAIRAASSDTAAYARSGPGSGATGWVDDGSVVRLESIGDWVGIGTNSPHAPLVVGKDLGSNMGHFVVSGSYFLDDVCGFKMGYNTDNHTTLEWNGDGASFALHTKHLGTGYNNSLVVNDGKVGINNSYPSEPLSIGPDLGAYYGDFVQMGRLGSGRYSGFMCGEDEDNRGAMIWINNSNELRFGYKSGGVDRGNHLVLQDGNMIVNGDPVDASVQLPTGSISSVEIANEAGGAGSYEDDFWMNIIDGEPAVVLDSCVIDAPATGIVVAFATASLWGSTYDSHTTRFRCGISKNRSLGRYVELAGYSNWTAKVPVTVVDYFVVSAGETTFYLLADNIGDGFGGGTAYNPLIYTIFLPTTYNPGKSLSQDVGDSSVGHDVSNDSNKISGDGSMSSQPEAVDALRAEFDAKLKIMEEEFQRKLEEMQNKR
ncbi:MAG: hypothetical protein ABII79_03710 [bacterium]